MSENTIQDTLDIQQEPAPVLVEMSEAVIANDGNIILADVDITIRKGEFVYLLGKVGSGKSSIIKTLIAELPLKKGEAAVAGYSLRKIKRRHIPFLRRKLGVIFQDFQLLMDRSVEDNLLFVLEATGWKKRSQMAARAREVLAMVGLEDKAGKMPHQLSGGEQQRVAIARAFLNNPQVILADEPTGNLDEETATDIMNLFMKIHAEQQPAVLMVTHNRELYKRYPGRVLICEEGSVREMVQEIDFEI
ncbi:MAG: ATP-binding cassette domain-containing protein [Bacteroidales bacterium]|nr:ATP-binding cassette domain-containing protein [Bacteroidales bacterium]